jgi:phage regulator Rha-like protein
MKTNDKQQTAVDYYSKEIGRLTSDLITGKITGKQFVMLEIQLLEQAKEMEKEQAIKLYYEYELYVMMHESDVIMNESSIMTFGQFYKQTYGGGEQ